MEIIVFLILIWIVVAVVTPYYTKAKKAHPEVKGFMETVKAMREVQKEEANQIRIAELAQKEAEKKAATQMEYKNPAYGLSLFFRWLGGWLVFNSIIDFLAFILIDIIGIRIHASFTKYDCLFGIMMFAFAKMVELFGLLIVYIYRVGDRIDNLNATINRNNQVAEAVKSETAEEN